MKKDIAASVRARLLNLAKSRNLDFNQVLIRFALERILYRLCRSPYAEDFLLKGALLFTIWYDMPHRATRDVDLLGFGSSELQGIVETFREIAGIKADDGITYDPASVDVREIRKDAGYAGARILISGELAKAKFKTQIDLGFGDAVTPHPATATYPVLLEELPAPFLRTYPLYTVIAEKLHAITILGMTNSRMKDYFDLAILLERETLDNLMLAKAIDATFNRRLTPVPADLPIGLTAEFATDRSRQKVWRAFLKKNELPARTLEDVIDQLNAVLGPVLGRPQDL